MLPVVSAVVCFCVFLCVCECVWVGCDKRVWLKWDAWSVANIADATLLVMVMEHCSIDEGGDGYQTSPPHYICVSVFSAACDCRLYSVFGRSFCFVCVLIFRRLDGMLFSRSRLFSWNVRIGSNSERCLFWRKT